ncbi:TonB-dependent receptor [uncultured Sunxiuqinia sp.]|uniref:TonB-dependent receptor n=1 Tax=uncultured Sunxiuqinia sp. TaxID=1573825 RepID=UPI00262302C1|nr:TonB-dependent receptor [uncultured Sunxiuqinia sp.]
MKKNNRFLWEWKIPGLQKLLRVMKLTVFLLLISVISVFAGKTYSQTKVLNLSMKNGTVKEVLKDIEAQSEFYFMYSEKLVDVNRTVSVDIKNTKIDKVLDQLFANTDIVYKVKDPFILLTTPEISGSDINVEQEKSVSGKVTDESGEPLPGVTVLLKGTNNGTVTDINGNYSITDVPVNSTLLFSFIGMLSQEVVVSDQRSIDVTMKTDAIGIEEVVAVGYGTQRKANLTGAISSVNVEHLEGRAITQTSQALTGEMAGISVRQRSSEPGEDGADITIRGMGTFSGAGNNPLIIIDGVATSINWINPHDIKSVTILKDAASASIYGSRAANGVILIETKEGRKGFEVNYSAYAGWQKPIEWPDFLHSWEYAEAVNEAFINVGSGIVYTQEEIEKYKSGTDRENYPDENHYKNVFGSGSGFQTNHNLSFSGSGENSTYFFSAGYLENNGIVDEFVSKKYNIRLNINNQITKKLNLKVNLAGIKNIDSKPLGMHSTLWDGSLATDVMVYNAAWFNATQPGRKADGTYGNFFYASPLAALDSPNNRTATTHYLLSDAKIKYKLLESLAITGEAAYTFNQNFDKRFYSAFYVNETYTTGPEQLSVRNTNSNTLTLRTMAEFNKTFGDHSIYVLGGFEQEEFQNDYVYAYRKDFPNNNLHELSAGDADSQTNTGNGTSWSIRSFFGRAQYNFKDKYLLEANFRYDGSSRFPSDSRWGFFPSFSGAWRISEEGFFPEASWMDQLKLRASYGKLGNQQIGLYPYQQTIAVGNNYPIGGTITPGARLTTIANEDITWETTNVTNLGIDLTLFKGKLDVTAELFNKKTEDILYNISVVNLLGLSPTEVNAGEVRNRGFEITMNYRNQKGDFSYSIRPNFTYVKNEVVKLATVEQDISKGLFVGEPLGAFYGYVYDGMFLDQADIDSYPTQPYSASPGQLRYKDISGPDGIPDGMVDPTYDRKVIGSRVPKFIYASTFSFAYKNIDLSVQLQGEGGMKRKLGGLTGTAFHNLGNIQRWQWEGSWDPANPTRYPDYPRLEYKPNTLPTTWESSFWLKDGTFLKIKNVQLGYTLPRNLTETVGLKNVRVYANALNLYTFDKYPKGWDPDIKVDDWFWGAHYPLATTVTFGVDVKF